jgi:F-type H+-transporting ATPase subunit delta
MAELVTIARPYAEAVFQMADKANALPAWSATLNRMALVASNEQVLACMRDPNLSANRMTEVFVSMCGDNLSADAKSFVQVLASNNRLALLPEIRDLFEQAKHQREGVLDVQITSAHPLEEFQLGNLVGHLESKYKRKVNPTVSVDKELIGGVKIAIGDEVIDGSVRGKLSAMRAALAQ